MSRQVCSRTCNVPDRFFDDSSGLQSGKSFDKIVDRVSLSASSRLRKWRLTISETLGSEVSCRMQGVTFTQNSKRIEVAMVSLEYSDTCSRYTVQSWQRVKAWNREDMCSTEVFDCSTNPAKIV